MISYKEIGLRSTETEEQKEKRLQKTEYRKEIIDCFNEFAGVNINGIGDIIYEYIHEIELTKIANVLFTTICCKNMVYIEEKDSIMILYKKLLPFSYDDAREGSYEIEFLMCDSLNINHTSDEVIRELNGLIIGKFFDYLIYPHQLDESSASFYNSKYYCVFDTKLDSNHKMLNVLEILFVNNKPSRVRFVSRVKIESVSDDPHYEKHFFVFENEVYFTYTEYDPDKRNDPFIEVCKLDTPSLLEGELKIINFRSINIKGTNHCNKVFLGVHKNAYCYQFGCSRGIYIVELDLKTRKLKKTIYSIPFRFKEQITITDVASYWVESQTKYIKNRPNPAHTRIMNFRNMWTEYKENTINMCTNFNSDEISKIKDINRFYILRGKTKDLIVVLNESFNFDLYQVK